MSHGWPSRRRNEESLEVSTRGIRAGSWFLLLCGAIFFGAIFVTAESTSDRVFLACLSAVLIGFAAIGLRSAPKATLHIFTLTAQGIEHAKLGFIGWEEIRDVEIRRLFGTRGVAIWTRDPDMVTKRLRSRWLRAAASLNTRVGWPPLMLTENVVDVDALYAQVVARWRDAIGGRAFHDSAE